MRKFVSYLLIGLFIASMGAGVVMAKNNHYDYKVVGDDGVSYEITGKFGNYNEAQDHTSNRVTVYNADVYDYDGNYVGRADIVNWNKNSNNGAHAKWRVEETTPIDNTTVENSTESVVDDNDTTEEVVNNTTDDNDVIGSGSIEIDDNGTIINGTAIIPDDGHMCDNIPLSCTNVTHHNGNSKVANHNPAVKVDDDNATVKVVANNTCNCNCTHIVNVFIINELAHGHIIHDLLIFVIGFLVVLIVFLYKRLRR